MDKQTSDERLLKIIEGTSQPRRAGENILGSKKPFGQASGQLLKLKFNLVLLKSALKNLKFNLAKINTVLIGGGIFLTLIFIYVLFSAPVISKSNAAYFIPADSASIVKFISAGQEQGLMRRNIAKEDLKRDFFLPANSKAGNLSGQESADLLEGLKDLKLVGIIWSQHPEVMIENAKDARTYTLKKGESLNEQIKVKEVSRSSAVLEVNLGSGMREYELR